MTLSCTLQRRLMMLSHTAQITIWPTTDSARKMMNGLPNKTAKKTFDALTHSLL